MLSGENDVEYAEFSMAQRMRRGSSPSTTISSITAGAMALSPTNDDAMISFEEKLRLLHLFDKSTTLPYTNACGSHTPTQTCLNSIHTGFLDVKPVNLDSTCSDSSVLAIGSVLNNSDENATKNEG